MQPVLLCTGERRFGIQSCIEYLDPNFPEKMKMCIASLKRSFAAFTFSVVAGSSLHAASISVPNYSFESQTAPTSPPYVNTFVDSWQKATEPAYYGPAIG